MSTIETRRRKREAEEKKMSTSTEQSTEQTTSTEETTTTEQTQSTQQEKAREMGSPSGTGARNAQFGSRATITSGPRQRRALLEAKMELEKRELALAQTRLELLQLEQGEEEDNLSEASKDANEAVSEWLDKSVDLQLHNIKTASANPRRGTRKPLPPEIAQQAAPICKEVDRKCQALFTPAPPPRYINELHFFDGNPRDWIAFKATYRDTQQYFSPIENVARLRRAVTGQARDAVKSQLYTNTNPDDIMKQLERRFGKPTRLIKSEIAALERLPYLTDDMQAIGIFASAVSNSVSTIQQMNRHDYLYSSDVSDKIINKMNSIVRFSWNGFRTTREDEPILLTLMAYLNGIADQTDYYENPKFSRFKPQQQQPQQQRPARNRVNATYEQSDDESSVKEECSDWEYEEEESYIETVAAAVEKTVDRCEVCSIAHNIIKCPVFEKQTVKERWETVKKLKICFRCLQNNHRSFNCKAKPCGKNGCNMKHHRLLHNDRPYENKDKTKPEQRIVTVNHLNPVRAYLKIIPVELSGPKGTATVSALLDEGSTISLLMDNIADQLGATGPTEELYIEGVGGQNITCTNSRKLCLRIKGLFQREYETINASTISQLNLASQVVSIEDLESCDHLVDLQDQIMYERSKPSLLIGQDNWHLIVSRNIRAGAPNKPVASLTKLGWVLHGCRSESVRPVKFVNHIHKEDDTENLIKTYFNLDSLGIECKRPSHDMEKKALNILEKTSRRLPEGRFESGLLWRNPETTMPHNRHSAERRLFGIERKMRKLPEFKVKYTQQIENLLKSGYAEPAEQVPTSPRTWYLPHFAVIHPQKQKVRLVFDAADKTSGKSLNDALLQGPDLLQSLFGTLIRFREGPVAVAADIKEMFLQIKIRQEDRDSLRFLWREKESENIKEYRMTSLIFGATSSPCTAIYIKNRNAQDFKLTHPEAVEAIERCHYMDDYLQSFKNEEDAKRIAHDVDYIHRKAGFELRGWVSNRASVTQKFTATSNTETQQISIGNDSQMERTLGLFWKPTDDVFKYALNLRNTPEEVLKKIRAPTKREITSAVMSVFDPLGQAAPVLAQGMKLIQTLWRTGIKWDEVIPDNLKPTWQTWIDSLTHLSALNITRCTNMHLPGQLHVFVDASETAYAAAAYWRTVENDRITIQLVAAKAKVTPLKPISIPRLELQAALLGCRLASSIRRETRGEIIKQYFWSDSRTTLAWIKADPRSFKPFVAHRLAEIEEHSSPRDWRWISTKENVADDATRLIPTNFTQSHRWFTGPPFLYYDECTWPEDKSETHIDTSEEKVKQVAVITQKKAPINLPNPSRFSSWNRLLYATARFLMSVEKFKQLRKQVNALTKKFTSRSRYKQKNAATPASSPSAAHAPPIPDEYLKKAEKLLIQKSQYESFYNERKCLEKKTTFHKDSKLRKLTVEIKNDVMCLSTRVGTARYLCATYLNPIILDGKHEITQLIIKQYHEDFSHANHITVMNEIRQKYHIISLRNTLKNINRKCKKCILSKRKPPTVPLGDLPLERLQYRKAPFTCTGVDYFGPQNITVGRKTEKRWVALYTCLTTRAIHLELVPSLTADSMIMSLRRMAARRGMPRVLYSDNGSNFTRANKELQDEFAKFVTQTQEKQLRWKFIPAGAPHMGGAWERLVRSVKTALSATLTSYNPNEETFNTLLLEAEHMINSRPLTPLSLEPDDEECLTPNHFLIGRSHGSQPIGEYSDETLVGRATWRTAQHLSDHFWRRWLKEYLVIIAPRSHNNAYDNPTVGDIVLITDPLLPRGVWPRGKIVTTYPGPDNIIRVVEVRTRAGILRRPTTRLIKLTSDRLTS